jgi:hypothetical protein
MLACYLARKQLSRSRHHYQPKTAKLQSLASNTESLSTFRRQAYWHRRLRPRRTFAVRRRLSRSREAAAPAYIYGAPRGGLRSLTEFTRFWERVGITNPDRHRRGPSSDALWAICTAASSRYSHTSLTEFLTKDHSPTGGPQDTRRTGSTRFWDVGSTGGPQDTGRTISGRLRIWRLGVRIPRGALLTSRFAGYRSTSARLVELLAASSRIRRN